MGGLYLEHGKSDEHALFRGTKKFRKPPYFTKKIRRIRNRDVSWFRSHISMGIRLWRTKKMNWGFSFLEAIKITGWWFGTFFIFHFIYGLSSFPLTFIFFKMVKTTNHFMFFHLWWYLIGWSWDTPPGQKLFLWGFPIDSVSTWEVSTWVTTDHIRNLWKTFI